MAVASFTASPVTGYTCLSVRFQNTSEDATSYRWDFGDGAKSTEVNPVHVYRMPGVYTVILTIYADGALITQAIQTDYIRVYDYNFDTGGLNVSTTNRCIRFAAK